MTVLVPVLYVVAFALFILGLSGLTGPRTAVRGNKIAAVGMLVAVLATLIEVRHNWLLILLGLVDRDGAGCAVRAAVQMTAMPQMVALFNGVGGGAVALIAWSEFRTTEGFAGEPAYVVIASLFGAIVGSISFWGSLVAFGKLQEILPGRPLGLGRAQQAVNLLLLAGAAACAASAAIGGAELWFVGLLVLAAVLGVMVVLPIGGADMPVVISPAQRADRAVGRGGRAGARQHRHDRRRDDRGRVGHDPDQPHGDGDEPVDPGDRRGRVRRDVDGAGRRRRRRPDGQGDERRGRRDPDGVRATGRRGPRVRHGRRPGAARREGHGVACWRRRASRSSTPSTRSPGACPGT